MSRPRWAVPAFLAAFALSIAVRLPQLNRPLSKNHEFCTALVLMVQEVWRQDGFLRHHGCPSLTWPVPGDRGVVGLHYGLTDVDGVFYYLSHLPLAYWVPAAAFAALRIAPSPLALQVFNLALHGLTAWLLAVFLARMLADHARRWAVGVKAGVLYLLMPGPLWFHGNVYMADMAVQLPWAWGLMAFAAVWRADRPARRTVLPLLGATAALSATEWVAAFAVPVQVALLLGRWRRTGDRSHLRAAVGQGAVALLAMGACLALYASVTGPHRLWAYLLHRYAERGVLPVDASATVGQGLWHMGRNLLTSWGPLLAVLAGVLALARPRLRPLRTVLLLTAVPGVLYLLVFTRYAIHEFALLKAGFALCALCAHGLVRFADGGPAVRWAAPLGLAAGLGMAAYTWFNPPGDGRRSGAPYATAWEQGRVIAHLARPDEVVLVRGIPPEPQLEWYARRNVRATADDAQALRMLRELGARRALVVEDDGRGTGARRLALP